MDKLITVCIACYNSEAYIERCLKSVTNQNYKNIEIICIDDASKDGTVKIIEKLMKSDRRIKLYKNDDNMRLVYTRKKGIKNAHGDYVLNMDSDDTLPKNAIKTAVDKLREYEYPEILEYRTHVIFTGKNKLYDSCLTFAKNMKDFIFNKNYCRIHFGKLEQPMMLEELINDSIGQMIWNKFIKRELLLEAYKNCDKENIYQKEDVYVCCFLYAMAHDYVGIKNRLYNYYFNTGKSKVLKSQNDFAEMCKLGSVIKSLLTYYDKLQDENKKEQYLRLILVKERFWLNWICNTLKDNSSLDREVAISTIKGSFSYIYDEQIQKQVRDLYMEFDI